MRRKVLVRRMATAYREDKLHEARDDVLAVASLGLGPQHRLGGEAKRKFGRRNIHAEIDIADYARRVESRKPVLRDLVLQLLLAERSRIASRTNVTHLQPQTPNATARPSVSRMRVYTEKSQPAQNIANTAFVHEKSAFLVHALDRSPTKGPLRIHEDEMRPAGRISTYMPSVIEMFGRISVERRVALMLH